jgi:hypothetical protein
MMSLNLQKKTTMVWVLSLSLLCMWGNRQNYLNGNPQIATICHVLSIDKTLSHTLHTNYLRIFTTLIWYKVFAMNPIVQIRNMSLGNILSKDTIFKREILGLSLESFWLWGLWYSSLYHSSFSVLGRMAEKTKTSRFSGRSTCNITDTYCQVSTSSW